MKITKDKITEKVCKKCGILKPASDFYKNGKYLLPRCKPCHGEATKARYLITGGEQARRWRERNPSRAAYLAASQRTLADPSSYPLNTVPFGPCELCGEETKRMHDHCHKTGRFRGMLCHPCNVRLWKVDRYLGWHKRAISYIEKVRNDEL